MQQRNHMARCHDRLEMNENGTRIEYGLSKNSNPVDGEESSKINTSKEDVTASLPYSILDSSRVTVATITTQTGGIPSIFRACPTNDFLAGRHG